MEIRQYNRVRYRPSRISRWPHGADEKPAAGAAATVEDASVAAEADAHEAARLGAALESLTAVLVAARGQPHRILQSACARSGKGLDRGRSGEDRKIYHLG